MKCWLCKRPVYSGYLNPFGDDSQLCDECHRCVETTFDEEKPSAARLFHELSRKSRLSILQLEESWIDSRLKAAQKVSEAAYVDDKLDCLKRRQSELTLSWEEHPPDRPDVAEFMDDYFWAFYSQANRETQNCLERAGERALRSSRQLSSLHILHYLTDSRAETVAHTLLVLAEFDVRRSQRELILETNREVPKNAEEEQPNYRLPSFKVSNPPDLGSGEPTISSKPFSTKSH